ncbi:MAG TPA: hypothetical protein VI603_03965 [Saprospiraceae bacterium]|nr:hypothetical protein [Saprospiraceae bacterium]
MSKKKFVLRMDEDLYQVIERWANDEFRSVNGQIEWMLHQQLRDAGRFKKNPSPGSKREKPKD